MAGVRKVHDRVDPEAVLDAWAQGLKKAEIAQRLDTSQNRVEQIVRVARDKGDPRCAVRRKPGKPAGADAPDAALRRDVLRARRETQAGEDVNAEILAALAAEPRPAGTPWGFPNAASRGSMIGVEQAQERVVVDITATFFGDPPPGHSALDMRGRG